MTTIQIKKSNSISRAEFKMLIEDPKIHLTFLRQRVMILSENNIDSILAELEEVVTDVYYANVIDGDSSCQVYFWSPKDFANFRR